MKAIQVLFDEELLWRFDSDEEVRRQGRSAVLRQAAAEYLRRRQRDAVSDQYRRAYSDRSGLSREFAGWENQGKCPEE